MVKSNLPNVTVTPEVMASNLCVMGSVPPVVPVEATQEAIDAHGAEYAEALFVALEALGYRITRPAADEDDALVTCDNCDDTSEAGWGDTSLCTDCQREEDPTLVCDEHEQTHNDGEPCNVCAALGTDTESTGSIFA